ncbi:hypothetical protein Vadar_023228 [Vaccinium darrowii]|uniref:Uncharacterized protein n=1 Tax=Vaccinium darrowii TaxID=229202 RepID=A0ACB7YGL6_9ERIC|nr:hypothetical protein Vadar_023228 [Vaccinium darrowii]
MLVYSFCPIRRAARLPCEYREKFRNSKEELGRGQEKEEAVLHARSRGPASAPQIWVAKSTDRERPFKVTSESRESVPPKLTVEPTHSAPSEVTNLSAVSAPTTASSENILPESTTMSSVRAQPPGLTATSEVQSVPPELTSKARQDAFQLHRAFEGWGCDAPTIVKILAHRSVTQRALIRREYKTKFSEDLDNRLSKELKLSADLKLLHKAMDRLGTDNKTLSRTIVSRAEIDIQQIKAEYLKKYGKSLSDEVHSQTSGNYRAFLLSLLDTHN